jgi:phosphate starvation-inducible PhoH-like protein
VEEYREESRMARRLKRKERKALRHQNQNQPSFQIPNINLRDISPMTDNQSLTFSEYNRGQHLFLHGTAGTGKTFLSFYLALRDIHKEKYKKLIVIRSTAQARDMGFLPGNANQKLEVFSSPYIGICAELYGRGDAWDILQKKGSLNMLSTSFLRGETYRDSIILLDEAQNCTFQEISTVITRVGENSKILICGDTKQTDLLKSKFDVTGINEAKKIASRMRSVSIIEFTLDDIVRSGIVKEWILAENACI